MKKGYVDTAHGQIHYRTDGPEDAPAILFFHQTASSGRMFEGVIARLAAEFRCYAFDTPGFGQSYQPAAIPSLAWLGDRLVESFDALGLERFVLCGHHTGGCVALEIAHAIPRRVRGLSIIGPVTPTAEERAQYRQIFTEPFRPDARGEFLPVAWKYLEMIGAASSVELHTVELVDHLIAWRTMPMAFGAVWEQDATALLQSVRVPLQLVCSEDDVLWPMFGRACALRPDAKTAIVQGGDYQPDRDPDGVATVLREFAGSVGRN